MEAQFDYDSGNPDGLAFSVGEIMQVLEQVDENWISVRKVKGGARAEGLAPMNYVKNLP